MGSSKYELTFACLYALEPRVIELGVAGISTFLEPSTAGSATTQLAGFLVSATLGTHATDCCYDGLNRH